MWFPVHFSVLIVSCFAHDQAVVIFNEDINGVGEFGSDVDRLNIKCWANGGNFQMTEKKSL